MAHIGYAVTNGGTLEDCHTNVFLLTELNGLKWCKFSLPSNFNADFSDTCDDLILNAYSQCLKYGVLSVWRRIPQAPANAPSQNVINAADQLNNFNSNSQAKTDFRLNAEKELQVFWYGEEPDWTLLATSNLTKSCKGSWEDGIDYETRTLLFKSLHNLIEKCLLGNCYIRLGRWFLKPLPSFSASSDKELLLAFSLSFFIHGENDVCVCVNVQKQPAVYQIGNEIPTDKQSLPSQQPSNASSVRSGAKRAVILSPWSIKGYVNLDEFKYIDSEQVKARKMEILREWAKFYPITATEDSHVKKEDTEIQSESIELKVPSSSTFKSLPNGNLPVVEVNVGGVKILYPSFYVLMVSQDDKVSATTNRNSAVNLQGNFGVFSSSVPCSPNSKGSSAAKSVRPSTLGRLQRRILERIEEELTLNKTNSASTSDLGSEFSSNLWNFAELPNNPLLIPSLPADKETCRCSLYPLPSNILLPGASSSTGGNGGGQSSPQVPNKAQLKFGLAASGHTIGNVGKVKQERRDKLQKCGAFHKRQSMPASIPSTPITASVDSRNPLASMTQYGHLTSIMDGSSTMRTPLPLNTVAPIAVTVAPSASIQMISPVASSTNVASIMQPFNDSSAASVNTPLYTSHQSSSYHFPENLGSEVSLAENVVCKMVQSPSTQIGTKCIAKSAAFDQEKFSLYEQPCTSSSPPMIVLKRSLTDNRICRIVLPYRRLKNPAKNNTMYVDHKRYLLMNDRNRSRDEPLDSLCFYDRSNNYSDGNADYSNVQPAAIYQPNGLDCQPGRNLPQSSWTQPSVNSPIHQYMYDYGHTNLAPQNPAYAPALHPAPTHKSAVPRVHLTACDTKVNLWMAIGVQHQNLEQNSRVVGEGNGCSAQSSSQPETINDSRLFQTCDTYGANATMLTVEHQQWLTPPQASLHFTHAQQSVQNEPNMHTMPTHLQQHPAMSYSSVDQQYNYQQLPQQQQFASTMTNVVNHQMAMPENIMADSGESDSEEDHSTLSEAAKRPAVASLLDYGIYPTPPSVDGATQFSPESCSATSGRLDAHTINPYHSVNITSQNSRATVETNENPADKMTSSNHPVPSEQSSSKYKLSDELLTILSKFAQSNKFGHVTDVSRSRSSLSHPISSRSTKRKLDTTINRKSLLLEYKPNNTLPFHSDHAANNNLYNSPIGQILQTTSGRNQTFTSPMFSPPSKFSGFPFSPSSGGRHPSGGGGGAGGCPSSVNPLSALSSFSQPPPPFSSPVQPLQQLQRQQPPPPQFVDRSPLPQNSPYSAAKTPKTPMGLDLQSPLSNASSHYTNRNLGSIGGVSSSVYTNFCPEANGLYLSLLLCDTFLNLHKDCVFDSCPLCVCCMNIQGSFAEVSLYLLSQPSALGSNDQNYQPNTSKCSCGFSASRNRYLTYKSGQFHEDECEVTGLWPGAKRNNFGDDPLNVLGQDRVPFDIIELIRSYSLMPDFHLMLPVANWRLFAQERRKNSAMSRQEDKAAEKAQDLQVHRYDYSDLELNDFAEYCNMALEQASLVGDCTTPSRDDLSKIKSALVHSWAFLKARKPISSVDAVSLIRNLQPLLQESIQKPRNVHQSKHSVDGPLTWRQFHRKCSHRISNSAKEDLSGPEPVPTLLVSVEKEWVSLSPFSLRFWDRLSLEPFGQTKDVAYVVVLPDNPSLAHKARIFFRELSKTYESMRLGRHCPLSKVLKDGLMRVSKTRVSQVMNLSVDPWFERLEQACQAYSNRTASCSASDNMSGCEPPSSAAATLPTSRQILAQKYKVYAQVCRHSLAPHLAEHIFDRTIFRDQSKESTGVNVSAMSSSSADNAMPPPATPSPSGPFYDSGQESMYSDVSGCEVSLDPNSLDYSPPVPHVTVVYLINAFTYGLETGENEEDDRLTTTALFRCYLEVLNGMPLPARAHVQLQIVPLQAVLEFTCPNDSIPANDTIPVTRSVHRQLFPSQSDYYRQLALNIFSQSRSVGAQFLLGFQAKPLTAIGPAATRIEIIKRKIESGAVDPSRSLYRLYCPAVVLASSIGEQQQAAAAATVPLLASSSANFGAVTACDEASRVLFITYCPSDNLNSSSQSQRSWLLAAATDHQGVLLENCVIDTNINNRWCAARRSVIFEALKKLWDFICGLLANGCQPWRLVIGRLGRIGHDELKVWAHLLNKNQLRATSRLLRDHCGICPSMPGFQETPCILSACLISTEADAHLRVFPDSFAYDERFGQSAKQCPLSTPEDVSCTHLMVFPTSAFQMSQNGVVSNSGIGPMDDMDEFNMNWDIPDGIDGIDDGNLNELLGESGFDGGNLQNRMAEATDDSIQLQPLALGYIVSTAPIEDAPDFFWSYCPSARYTNPVHLRSALHINTSSVQQNDDQFLTNAGKNVPTANNHALDSSLTTDVLRYALETYNALSWLSLNPSTGDRRSCLPIHMQALCRLHRTLNRLL